MGVSLVSAILVLSFSLTLAEELGYRMLEDLKASCSPYDTCALGKRNRAAIASSNCACDHLCVEYKDCCIDAPYRKHHSSLNLSVKCKDGIYVFNKCPLGWRGSRDVKTKCERRNNVVVEDPFAEAPLTDSETDVTYRNSYCAHCNGARGPFHHWNGNIVCESLRQYHATHGNITQDYVTDNLVQSANKKWGINLWNKNMKKMVFYECNIGYELPNRLLNKTRWCTPNVVSKCHRGWARDAVQRHCESYTAVVYVNEKAYRNPHCVLCNFVSLENRKCEGPVEHPGNVVSRKRPPMSFSLLLDINGNDGNTVGVTNSCPRDQAYDPYFKKCRPMMCAIPEYVVRYGKCVPP